MVVLQFFFATRVATRDYDTDFFLLSLSSPLS
jgi:hypothetical protein